MQQRLISARCTPFSLCRSLGNPQQLQRSARLSLCLLHSGMHTASALICLFYFISAAVRCHCCCLLIRACLPAACNSARAFLPLLARSRQTAKRSSPPLLIRRRKRVRVERETHTHASHQPHPRATAFCISEFFYARDMGEYFCIQLGHIQT
jgi:hypothetical protein